MKYAHTHTHTHTHTRARARTSHSHILCPRAEVPAYIPDFLPLLTLHRNILFICAMSLSHTRIDRRNVFVCVGGGEKSRACTTPYRTSDRRNLNSRIYLCFSFIVVVGGGATATSLSVAAMIIAMSLSAVITTTLSSSSSSSSAAAAIKTAAMAVAVAVAVINTSLLLAKAEAVGVLILTHAIFQLEKLHVLLFHRRSP